MCCSRTDEAGNETNEILLMVPYIAAYLPLTEKSDYKTGFGLPFRDRDSARICRASEDKTPPVRQRPMTSKDQTTTCARYKLPIHFAVP